MLLSIPAAARGKLLLCAALSLSGVSLAWAQPVSGRTDQLVARFGKCYRDKDWPTAIEIGLELCRRKPNEAVYSYNLACAYALDGQLEEAASWLGKSARSGFARLKLVEADTDLDAIRADEGYRRALDRIRKNRERKRRMLAREFGRQHPVVILPPGYQPARPAPLLIALHGYGGRASGHPTQWATVAGEEGMILVAPQGVRQVAGAGYSWGDADEAEILIDLTLDLVRKQYKIDERRIVLTGFSQGAFIAYAVGVRKPDVFRGVIPMSGGYITSIDGPPKVPAGGGPRFYFMVGEHDRARDPMRRAARAYEAAGYDTRFNVYPAAGHTFPRDRDAQLRRALAFVLSEQSDKTLPAGHGRLGGASK